MRNAVAIAAMATLALLYFGLAATADAETADVAKLVKTDIGQEAAECSVYFALVGEAHRRSLPPGQKRDKEVADWSRLSKEAAQLSRQLIGEENSLAMIKIGVEKIKRMTKNSLDNMVVATAEYGYACKDLMDDPPKRWNYWLDKELK